MKRNEIERLLPGVFQRTAQPGTPLDALLHAMEALHAPDQEALAHLESYFSAYEAPDEFVPMLARWVDLDRLLAETPDHPADAFAGGLGRLRELVAAAAYLSKWRGTARGLLRFLQTATGLSGWEIDETVPGADGQPRPFHIRVVAPTGAARYRALVERIVEMEKPAYVTYELAMS